MKQTANRTMIRSKAFCLALCSTIFACSLLWSVPASAQNAEQINLVSPRYDYQMKVEKATMQEIDGKVVVSLKLNAMQDVPTHQSVVLIPELEDTISSHSVSFPAIYINSRNQQIFYDRELKRVFPDAYAVRKKKGEHLHIDYMRSIPYEKWMKSAVLKMHKLSCGCNVATNRGVEWLASFDPDQVVFDLYPTYRFPKPEAEKIREEKGSANICFVVDQTDIRPTYMNNAREISKINNSIDLVKNDTNVTIRNMSICGYASPEGVLEHNVDLSLRRTEALKVYIYKSGILSRVPITASSKGENWEGFISYLNGHAEVPQRYEMLDIANMNIGADEKEALLNSKTPVGYKYCLENCFPSLRCTDYVVEYIVRPFSLEESERIFETKPVNLSLNEIYLLGEKYKHNEQKYNSIMQRSYMVFPDDPYINLTMSYIAIKRHMADEAEGYLEKVPDDWPEKIHNQGLIAYLRGDMNRARQLISEAAAQGVGEASAQLQEFSKIK